MEDKHHKGTAPASSDVSPREPAGRPLANGWKETRDWVFCSAVGSSIDPRNSSRNWERLRRRAQAEGIRSLKLHATRHTWASMALESGKNIRWVTDQLGQLPTVQGPKIRPTRRHQHISPKRCCPISSVSGYSGLNVIEPLLLLPLRQPSVATRNT